MDTRENPECGQWTKDSRYHPATPDLEGESSVFDTAICVG